MLRGAPVRRLSLKATEQPIDTDTACFLDMLGVFAEFETNLRRERQLEGRPRPLACSSGAGLERRAQVREMKAQGLTLWRSRRPSRSAARPSMGYWRWANNSSPLSPRSRAHFFVCEKKPLLIGVFERTRSLCGPRLRSCADPLPWRKYPNKRPYFATIRTLLLWASGHAPDADAEADLTG
jgi:hypothetical protein